MLQRNLFNTPLARYNKGQSVSSFSMSLPKMRQEQGKMMFGEQRFRVRFWGVRGSYATPGPQTVRHGGNTSCVEVQAGPHTLILDAGTGIIGLGKELLRRAAGAPLRLSLFITHGHGDHLLGIPFFTPLY